MTVLRQTHLGPTCLKSLTIVDLPSHESLSNKDTRTLIFQLPDELLLRILEFAPREPDLWQHGPNHKNGMLLALSRVCQRLRRVAQQLLYRDISVKKKMTLSAPMVPPSIPVIKFHRTLRERVDLRRHCRRVLLLHYSCSVRLMLLTDRCTCTSQMLARRPRMRTLIQSRKIWQTGSRTQENLSSMADSRTVGRSETNPKVTHLRAMNVHGA
jgi:hypothetical protein